MENDLVKSDSSYWIIKVYPFGVLALALALNLLFGISEVHITNPSKELIGLLSLAAIILVLNHSWIMTVTELTRNRFKIFASPEEWIKSGYKKADISEIGTFEIDRCLNTHRNTTENTLYYILLAVVFIFVSPNIIVVYVWLLLFPIARLGYTYCYFSGRDNIRGVFMSLTLAL